jgi:hypothetical protein
MCFCVSTCFPLFSVEVDAIPKIFGGFVHLAIALGKVVELSADSRYIVHDAPILKGMSGGPIIALEEYEPHLNDSALKLLHLPFIGIQSLTTNVGYSVGVRVTHPTFVAEYKSVKYGADGVYQEAHPEPLTEVLRKHEEL